MSSVANREYTVFFFIFIKNISRLFSYYCFDIQQWWIPGGSYCFCALYRWSFTLSFLLPAEASAGPHVSRNERRRLGIKEKEVKEKRKRGWSTCSTLPASGTKRKYNFPSFYSSSFNIPERHMLLLLSPLSPPFWQCEHWLAFWTGSPTSYPH